MTALDLVSWLAVTLTALWVVLSPDPTNSPEAPPPGLTLVRDPPPELAERKRSDAGGIPHAERLRLERVL